MKRSPVFWILLAVGGSMTLCCLGTMGVVALGALTADSTAAAPAVAGGGGQWIPSGEVARGTGLTQTLSGGRWVAQSGGRVEIVKVQFANSALVDTNTNGILHELTFDDDGRYQWQWVQATQVQTMHSRSSADERGTWSLDGSTLMLTPESQKAQYTAQTQSQDKEDIDLSPRTYQVVDITLETVRLTGAPERRFPGVELKGPPGPWDLTKNTISLDLQRL